MTEMPGQSLQDNLPIYSPVGFMGFDEWVGRISSRTNRIYQLVQPKIAREITRLNNSAVTAFLDTAIEGLIVICQTQFTDQGRLPSAIPIFCILDESSGGKRYNLDGDRGTHNDATLLATQVLVDALCPEQGIDIDGDWQDLIDNAVKAEELGYAEVRNTSGDPTKPNNITHPTIIPGVSIHLSTHGPDRYISLGWNVM